METGVGERISGQLQELGCRGRVPASSAPGQRDVAAELWLDQCGDGDVSSRTIGIRARQDCHSEAESHQSADTLTLVGLDGDVWLEPGLTSRRDQELAQPGSLPEADEFLTGQLGHANLAPLGERMFPG